MKKKSDESAFLTTRSLTGLFFTWATAFLIAFGSGAFVRALSSKEQSRSAKPESKASCWNRGPTAQINFLGANKWSSRGRWYGYGNKSERGCVRRNPGRRCFSLHRQRGNMDGNQQWADRHQCSGVGDQCAGHIFAGTFSSGVFRSTDNGDTWTASKQWLGFSISEVFRRSIPEETFSRGHSTAGFIAPPTTGKTGRRSTTA